jgi:hypothetical protein
LLRGDRIDCPEREQHHQAENEQSNGAGHVFVSP